MANAGNQVIFYPLERLDKIDVDAVQSLAHNYVESALGATMGATGMLSVTTVIADNTNEVINFGDFTYLGGQVQHEGVGGVNSGFIGMYRASSQDNLDCSFDAVRALVQSYYNTNDSLPPTPIADDYVEGSHHWYYPYVYVGCNLASGDNAQRMFWSTADGAETADAVDTRTKTYFHFALAGSADAVPTGGDFPMIRIARIISWTVAGGVVSLDTVSPLTLGDDIFDLGEYTLKNTPFSTLSDLNKVGLAGVLHWLKERQDSMMDAGVSDPVGTQRVGDSYGARLSLAGLERRVVIEEQRVARCSAVIMSMINKTDATDEVITRNYLNNDFDITAHRDFAPLLSTRSTGGTALTAPIAEADYCSTLSYIEQAINSLSITIPSEYAGYGIQISLSNIYPALSESQYFADGVVDSSNAVNDYGYDTSWFVRPHTGHNTIATNTWLDQLNTVSANDAAITSGGADRSGTYGLCIMGRSGVTSLEAVNQHELHVRYVKVDITLIKPSA